MGIDEQHEMSECGAGWEWAAAVEYGSHIGERSDEGDNHTSSEWGWMGGERCCEDEQWFRDRISKCDGDWEQQSWSADRFLSGSVGGEWE